VSAFDALTTAHFLCGERLTALPSGTEPQIEKNLTKAHQRTQKLADDFWKRWENEYLIELRNFHEVCQPKRGSAKVQIWRHRPSPRGPTPKTYVKKGLRRGAEDGAKRTAVLRAADGRVLVRPIQLVIPLEIDQGGEDVEDP
jgi:ATP-dependent exoDNAse (exonuclease V) beta subunit